jgi:hypothetical protein
MSTPVGTAREGQPDMKETIPARIAASIQIGNTSKNLQKLL